MKKESVLLILEEAFQKSDSKYYSNGNWILYGQQLLKHFKGEKSIWIPCKPVVETALNNEYDLNNSETNIIEAPFYNSFASFFKLRGEEKQKLRSLLGKAISEHDIIIVRAPSQLAATIVKLANGSKKIITFMVGNFLEAARPMNSKNPLVRMVFKPIANRIQKQQIMLVQASRLLVAYGEELKREFSEYADNIVVSRTSLISETDIIERENTCLGATIKILRIASYLKNKDYELLIDSINELRLEGHNIELRAFGAIYEKEYFDKLKSTCSQGLTLSPALKYGSPLFDEYLSADIQVICSKSEGIPRTILEGAAFSLPLISTKAGGIPSIIEHEKNGLLIAKSDKSALKSSILQLIKSKELRKNLIINGLKDAKKNSVENITHSLYLKIIEAYGN